MRRGTRAIEEAADPLARVRALLTSGLLDFAALGPRHTSADARLGREMRGKNRVLLPSPTLEVLQYTFQRPSSHPRMPLRQ